MWGRGEKMGRLQDATGVSATCIHTASKLQPVGSPNTMALWTSGDRLAKEEGSLFSYSLAPG